MNELLLAVTFIAVVNPLRTRLGLPETDDGAAQRLPLLIGTTAAFGAIALLAWLSGPLLDSLEITAEYSLTAAGVVGIAAGLWVFFFSEPASEPELEGWRSAIWPVAFPRLITPELFVISLAIAAHQGVADALWPVAVALGLVVVAGLLRPGQVARRALMWSGRLLAMLLVLGGIWFVIEGIRAV